MNHVECDACIVKCMTDHERSSGSFFFFTLMFKNFETKLIIPMEASRKILNLVNQTTSIEDSLGKSWNVEISEFEGRLVFQEGWEIFVKAHGIEFGNFLVFQYIVEKSSFVVRIFEKSGCERLEFPSKSNSNGRNYTSKQKQGDDGDYCGLKSSIPNEDPTKVKNLNMEWNQVDNDGGGINISIPKEDLATHKKTDFKRKRDDDCGGFKSSIINEHLSKPQKSNVHASGEAKLPKPIDYNHLLESMKRPIYNSSKKMAENKQRQDDDIGDPKTSITNQDLTKIQKTNVDASGQAKVPKKIDNNDLLEIMTCHLRMAQNLRSLQDDHDCIIVVEEDGTCHIYKQEPDSSIQFKSNASAGTICGDTFTMDGNNAARCIQPGSDMNFLNKFHEKPESTKQANPCKDSSAVDEIKNGNNDEIHIHATCDDVKSCNITKSEKVDVEGGGGGGGNNICCSMGVDSAVKENNDEHNKKEKSLAIVTTIKKTESNLFLLVPVASSTNNDLSNRFIFRVTGNPHRPWLKLSEEPLPLPKKKERKVVLFRDSKLNVWPILYVESKSFIGFLGGWQAFASTQDIQKGDLCSLNMASEFYSLFDVRISRM